ncbi:MAG: hypothetical protein Kow00129_12840 [Thermoleophilia bacterium]
MPETGSYSRALDPEREHAIERLTGINSSKKTYYPALRQKVDELETTNRLLERALHSLGSISQALTMTTHGVDAFLEQLTATVGGITGSTHTLVLEMRDLGDGEAGGLSRKGSLQPLWPPGGGLASGKVALAALERLQQAVQRAEGPFWLDGRLSAELSRVFARGSEATGDQSWLCVPLRRGMVSSGAILAVGARKRWLEESELEALRVLGSQTAVALENTRLYETGERLRRRAEEHYSQAVAQKTEVEAKRRELEEALNRLSSVEQERVLQQERARIARELHDSVAQVLYSIGLQLDWARSRTESDPELCSRISGLRELASSAVKEIRQTIFDLAPERVGATGLRPALERLAREYSQLFGFPVDFEAEAVPGLPSDVEEGLYRIAQEALLNVYKHARATKVFLGLSAEAEGRVVLTVCDDGAGLPEGCESLGYGIRTMRQRAAALGASFECNGGPGAGTCVRVTAPVR